MRPLHGLRVGARTDEPAVARCIGWLVALGAERADDALQIGIGGDRAPAPDAPVRLHLPAFPADHPRAGEPLDVGAVAALAGVYDPPFGRSRVHPLSVPDVLAAAYGAVAAVAAWRAVERGGPGRRIEVAELDAALHAHELTALLRLDPPSRWSPLAWAASPFVAAYAGSDGRWVFVHLGLPRHLARFRAWLRERGLPDLPVSEATAADPLAVGTVREAFRLRRALVQRFAAAPASDWEDQLSAAGLCAAVCRTAEEWRAHPHGRLVDPGGAPVEVRSVVAVPHAVTAAPIGPPLAGVRVLDLSRVIAGPVAGRTLAALGAEVTKVIDPGETQGWVEAFRTAFDAGKRPVALDTRTDEGRAGLRALLAERWDVLLHNARPEAVRRLGLDAGRPPAVIAAVSAYGGSGPWSGRPGWEQTAQAAVGTQLEYGGGRPELVPLPITDLATGLFCALGVVSALRAGGGRVEAALTTAQLHLRHGAPTGVVAEASALRSRFAERPGMLVRSPREGLGEVTEVPLPWRGEGLATVLPGPGAVPGAPGDRGPVRRAAHLLRWAPYLAWTRR